MITPTNPTETAGMRRSPLLDGEGQGDVCDVFGEFAHLAPTLSVQERETRARWAGPSFAVPAT